MTSQSFNGDLQGVAGADGQCQAAASASGLGGSWVAWLSDGNVSASLRLQAAGANGPWHVGPDTLSAVVFASRNSTGFTPQVEINIDENGDSVPVGLVWTGTRVGGDAATNHCVSWTDDTTDNNLAAHDVYGRAGSVAKIDDDWTDALEAFCLDELHLYCFEI